MEKMTSLMTCAMSPCCASTAIFVLLAIEDSSEMPRKAGERRVNVDVPVLDAFGELVLVFLLVVLLFLCGGDVTVFVVE